MPMNSRPPASGVGRDDLATEAQVRALYLIGRDKHRMTEGEVQESSYTAYGRPPHELSRQQAGTLISQLQRKPTPHLAARKGPVDDGPWPFGTIHEWLIEQGFLVQVRTENPPRTAIYKRSNGDTVIVFEGQEAG